MANSPPQHDQKIQQEQIGVDRQFDKVDKSKEKKRDVIYRDIIVGQADNSLQELFLQWLNLFK